MSNAGTQPYQKRKQYHTSDNTSVQFDEKPLTRHNLVSSRHSHLEMANLTSMEAKDTSSWEEKAQKIELSAREALQGLEDLKAMVASQATKTSRSAVANPEKQGTDKDLSSDKRSKHEASSIKQEMRLQLRQSRVKNWAKKALGRVKHTDTQGLCPEVKTISLADPKTGYKKTGWKLRSPLSRRSPPKEILAQAAEIERLKEALQHLESPKPSETLDPTTVGVLKNAYEKEIRALEEQLESQPKLRNLESKVKYLENEKQILQPLVQVGVAVRRRVFETYKRQTVAHAKEDLEIVRNGNMAAHDGNVAADAALFYLQELDLAKHGSAFETIYRIGLPESYQGIYQSAKATKIINFRGTIELSVHYQGKSAYEKFIELEKKCRAFLSVGGGCLSNAITQLNSDRDIEKYCGQMQQMASEIRNQARKSRLSGVIPRSAKELERRNKKNGASLQKESDLMSQSSQAAIVETKTPNVEAPTTKGAQKKKKKQKKREASGDGAVELAVKKEAKQVKVEVVEKGRELEVPTSTEIGHLGRVEVVIQHPGLFGLLSGLFSYMG